MKIEKPNMTVEDANNNLIETEEGITCGCGKPNLKLTMHIDGTDFYTSLYKCDCGNGIVVEHKRAKENEYDGE